MKYVCSVCGFVYDEEAGYPEGNIAPGTKWEDVPEDFECPRNRAFGKNTLLTGTFSCRERFFKPSDENIFREDSFIRGLF